MPVGLKNVQFFTRVLLYDPVSYQHRHNGTIKKILDVLNIVEWDVKLYSVSASVHYSDAGDGVQVNVLEPHPHLPLLATSGLDSDVKLWMPTACQPPNMSTLQRASGTGFLLYNIRFVLTAGLYSLSLFSDWMLYKANKPVLCFFDVYFVL